VIFTLGNRKILGAMSEKETWLNYTIHPFARENFDIISSVQLLAAKASHVFFCLNLL